MNVQSHGFSPQNCGNSDNNNNISLELGIVAHIYNLSIPEVEDEVLQA